jgi:hypothetical protein
MKKVNICDTCVFDKYGCIPYPEYITVDWTEKVILTCDEYEKDEGQDREAGEGHQGGEQ